MTFMTNHTLPPDALTLLPLALSNVPAGLRMALEQAGVPHIDHPVERAAEAADARFVLFDSQAARPPHLTAGQMAIDIAALRSGEPRDPFAALLDTRSIRTRWTVGALDVYEEVAATDKRAVRRRLLAGLRGLIEAAGGVWACVAAFPHPHRSAFNLRVDYDRYEPDDFQRFWGAIRGWEHAVSHFVCAAAFQPQPGLLARLAGADVGSHGCHHHSYRDETENQSNVRRGVEALRAWGLDPVGFAAPHGRWSAALGRCLDELQIPYSSEFALAYDELPFWPQDCRALQVPVHPLCLGLFLESASGAQPPLDATSAVDLAAEHWRQVAQAKYAAGEPVFLYDHPDGRLGRHPHVVRELLGTVSQLSAVWPTTLTQFSQWWRARRAIRLRLRQAGETLSFVADNLPAGYRVAVEVWRGAHVAPLPLDQPHLNFSLAALAYQSRPTGKLPAPTPAAYSGGLRRRVRQYLDWEVETPLAEVGTKTWPGWLKHRLRARREAQERRA